jgi:DmsE family decaheme c-type cytochrome
MSAHAIKGVRRMEKKGVPMTEKLNKRQMWIWLLTLLLVQWGSGVAFAQKEAPAGTSSAVSGQAAAQVDVTKLTGIEACLHCHKTAVDQVSKTAHADTSQLHAAADLAKASAGTSCDGCHGSSKAHADAELLAESKDSKDPAAKKLIFDFEAKTTTPETINKQCLTCHASGPTHLNSANSFHRQNDVGCTSCHSAHHSTTAEKLLVKAQPDLCYTCHLQQKSQFNMPFRHRVNEHLIQCTDCHDQHGTNGVWESPNGLTRQVRTSDSGNFVCFKCHKDKQGPFVFAHASVKVEGCATCHIPHGGANVHMLKYSNVNLLCLGCHTASTFGHGPNGTSPQTGFPVMDAQNSTQQQACTLCHAQIHGSNFSNLLFR